MEQYEIFITDKAFVDMEQIYEYIAGQLLAPQTALQLVMQNLTDNCKN